VAYRDEIIVLIDETEGLGEEFTGAASSANDLVTEASGARPQIEEIAAQLGDVQKKVADFIAALALTGLHVDELSRAASASADTAESLLERANREVGDTNNETAENGLAKLGTAKDKGAQGAARVVGAKSELSEVYENTEALAATLGGIVAQAGSIAAKVGVVIGVTGQASEDLNEAGTHATGAKEDFEAYLGNI
jgi:hypothetical protein